MTSRLNLHNLQSQKQRSKWTTRFFNWLSKELKCKEIEIGRRDYAMLVQVYRSGYWSSKFVSYFGHRPVIGYWMAFFCFRTRHQSIRLWSTSETCCIWLPFWIRLTLNRTLFSIHLVHYWQSVSFIDMPVKGWQCTGPIFLISSFEFDRWLLLDTLSASFYCIVFFSDVDKSAIICVQRPIKLNYSIVQRWNCFFLFLFSKEFYFLCEHWKEETPLAS